MNKSAILPMLAILLAISIIIGFDLIWYHYITCTLKSYGVADSDIIKRLDTFYFILGLEAFFAVGGTIATSSFMFESSSNQTAWPF